MKVSVIVPVYNSSEYLSACLDSLTKQTLQDMEIIAIDDNSTDDSLAILKEYQTRYPDKVKVFHNEKNVGQSATRNRGIYLAQGDYIGFLDSDDYVNYTMYQNMYEGAAQNGFPEVITTGLCFVKDNYYLDNDFSFLPSASGTLYNVLEDPSVVLNESPSVCNKLFRKDIIHDGLFLEGRMWEDVAFSFAKMFNANRILYFQSNRDYFYRRRMGEGVSSRGYRVNPHLLDIFAVADQIESETREKGRFEALKPQIRFTQTVTCLQRAVEIMDWPIAESDKDSLCKMMSGIIIKKYGDWRLLPIEELSSRVGFYPLEKLRSLTGDIDQSNLSNLESKLNTIQKSI